ncbi:MAG: GFA family protein [Paracoccaceae bacterium]|nr:GFA family protein [Paracoccaceae bacterium]
MTGRCYCGKTTFHSNRQPTIVSYCHCSDCRRLSGAPVAAFAAFPEDAVSFKPGLGAPVTHTPGVQRWFCASCGTPLAAQYDYLPDQTYVPLGLMDQAEDLPPALHSHTGSQLAWLDIRDDLERHAGSGRATLNTERAPK